MKAIGTLSVKNLLAAIAVGFALTAFSSASAAGFPFGLQQSASNLCGCDNRQGVEMYVHNVINDAQHRGLTCQSSYHIPACIISYCSICGNQPNVMASCVKNGMEYLSNFCSQQPTQLTAAYMPLPGTWF